MYGVDSIVVVGNTERSKPGDPIVVLQIATLPGAPSSHRVSVHFLPRQVYIVQYIDERLSRRRRDDV